jgi:hypothetical protein
MITLKHLDIYKRYSGNIDGWAIHNSNDKSMTDEIWYKIQGFIDNLTGIKNGLASDEFTKKTMQSLNDESENEDVANAIVNITKFPSPSFYFVYIYKGETYRAFADKFQFDGKSRYRIITRDIYCEITSAGVTDSENKTIWIQSDKLGEPIQPYNLVQAMGQAIEYAKMS